MKERINKLKSSLKEKKIDALIISNLSNIRYLTGFSGTFGLLLVYKKGICLYTDSRYYERAKKETRNISVKCLKGGFGKVLSKMRIKRLGFEEDSVTHKRYIDWKKEFRPTRLIPVSSPVKSIRQIKDKNEIKAVIKATKLTEEVLAKIVKKLKTGLSEYKIERQIESLVNSIKGAELSFPPIVAFGASTSMPHHKPGDKRLRANNAILIDLGVKIDGYSSDLTRTFWMGKMTHKFNLIYNILYKAQQTAIDAVKPGVRIKDIDSLARDYIKREGFSKYFGHALGHGIGIEVHETPRINTKNSSVLKPGMIFSVEPGIYIPGWGGIRIEDLVLVTEKGHKVLTKFKKTLNGVILKVRNK